MVCHALQNITKVMIVSATLLVLFSCNNGKEYDYKNTYNTENSDRHDYTLPNRANRRPSYPQQQIYESPRYYSVPTPVYQQQPFNPYNSAPYSRYYVNPYQVPAQYPVYDSDHYYQPATGYNNVKSSIKINNEKEMDMK